MTRRHLDHTWPFTNGGSCDARGIVTLQPEQGRKEGKVLFNDALNTFLFTFIWRQIYGKGPLR